MEKVILYTTHCPRCKVLADKLNEKHVTYEEFTDKQKMLEMGMDMNIVRLIAFITMLRKTSFQS